MTRAERVLVALLLALLLAGSCQAKKAWDCERSGGEAVEGVLRVVCLRK